MDATHKLSPRVNLGPQRRLIQLTLEGSRNLSSTSIGYTIREAGPSNHIRYVAASTNPAFDANFYTRALLSRVYNTPGLPRVVHSRAAERFGTDQTPQDQGQAVLQYVQTRYLPHVLSSWDVAAYLAGITRSGIPQSFQSVHKIAFSQCHV